MLRPRNFRTVLVVAGRSTECGVFAQRHRRRACSCAESTVLSHRFRRDRDAGCRNDASVRRATRSVADVCRPRRRDAADRRARRAPASCCGATPSTRMRRSCRCFRVAAVVVNYQYAAGYDLRSRSAESRAAAWNRWSRPGASNWNEIYPKIDTAIPNARNFIGAGKTASVLGAFQTVWHDDGESLYEATWYRYYTQRPKPGKRAT